MADVDLLELVRQFLDDDGWHPAPLEDRVLACRFQGDAAQWAVYVLVPADDRRVVIYSVTPETTAEDARPAVVDYLNRCNFRLLVGDFELDMEDGETRFRTSIDISGSDFDAALLRQAMHANVLAMDQYLGGIEAVRSGSLSPAAAHAEALAV